MAQNKQSNQNKQNSQNTRGSQGSQNLYNPGEDNAPAGEYVEVGPRGGEAENARQVTISSGDRLPPTQEAGNKWMYKK